MAGVFSEPTYILPLPSTSLLSETRPTHLSPAALDTLNKTIDETLFIVIHAALHSPPSSTTPTGSPGGSGGSPGGAGMHLSAPAPLEKDEVLTIERVKSAFARILGPTSLAKECILEAELAVRELMRRGSPSLRGDAALKKGTMWGTPRLPAPGRIGMESGLEEGEGEEKKRAVGEQANEIFRALREWVMQISGVGAACHDSTPNGLTVHLISISPPKTPPSSATSSHLTFLFVLYVERCLSTLASHLLRLIAGVSSRSSASEIATTSDLETAILEDSLYSWATGMRVWRYIKRESAREREAAKRGSPVLGSGGSGGGGVGGGGLSRSPSMSVNGPSHRKAVSVTMGSVSPSITARSTTANGGGVERKPSVTGSSLAPTISRRPSMESTRSALTYSSTKKGSTGLGILSGSSSTIGLDDNAFDQLISNGKTIKLSSTPDRLRTFERKDERKEPLRKSSLSGSASMPALSSTSTSSTSTTTFTSPYTSLSKSSSSRRLLAREPQRRDLVEETEEEEEEGEEEAENGDEGGATRRAQQKRKESLMDLLNSPPPWSPEKLGDEPPSAPPLPTLAQRRESLRPGGRPIDLDDATHPMSVAMRVQNSTTSTATMDSTLSGMSGMSGTSGEEAYGNTSPGARLRSLKAKDERRDLASERQINTDLMDFFANSPPISAAAVSPSFDPPAPLSPKKSKGGLRGLMGRLSGGGKKDDDTLPPDSPTSPRSMTSSASIPRRSGSRSQSIGGVSMMSTNSAVGAAALRAAGFSDGAAKAAYVPPPGLGSPKQPSSTKEQRSRSASISSHKSRGAAERERKVSLSQLPPPPPPLAPAYLSKEADQPPVGILKKTNGVSRLPPPLLPSDAEVSDTPTTTFRIPRRSSSLKRPPRDRDNSASANHPVLNPATFSVLPEPSEPQRRTREDSAASVSASSFTSAASAASRHPLPLPSAETSAPPVVLSTGLVQSLASKSSAETLSASSHARHASSREASSEELPPPIPAVDEALPPPSSSSSSAPPQLESTETTTPVHTPPAPSAPSRFPPASSPPTRALSHAQSSPTTTSCAAAHRASSPPLPSRVSRFSAPASPSSSFQTPLRRSPSLASSARAASPLALLDLSRSTSSISASGGDGVKSLTTTLKELRSAMRYATSKEQCVELVEALLRDNARRVEAMAVREDEERAARAVEEESREEGGDGRGEVRGEKGGEGEDEEQSRLVEFFLGGGDVEPPSSFLPPPLLHGVATDAEAEETDTLDDLPPSNSSLSAPTTASALPTTPPNRSSAVFLATPDLRIPGTYHRTPVSSPAVPSPPLSSLPVVSVGSS